jgi:HAE1 family hydrophobic/amphiphilic exporter-1
MEMTSDDPHKATSIAMAEVTSAVIATSLVLISVFVPVSFFPGTTGILYKQFSLTIAFSIAISAFNALTLSPALAAILLRPETEKKGLLGLLLNPVERLIQWIIRVYARAVTFVVRIRYAMLVLFVGALAATAYMYNHVPTAFIPQEDQSYFLIIVQTPPGASLSYTSEFADRVSDLVRKNDGVFGTFSVMGFSLAGGSSPNSGLIFAPLKPINERTKMGPKFTARAIVAEVVPNSSVSPEASPSPPNLPPSPASAPSVVSSSSSRTPAVTPSTTSTASPIPSLDRLVPATNSPA